MRTPIPDNSDIIEEWVADQISHLNQPIKSNFKSKMNINWKTLRIVSYFAIVFIVGGIQALKGSIPGDITSIVAILGIIEHMLEPGSTV